MSVPGKGQLAWDRIQKLGGHGVWDDMVVIVSLANTAITDNDLALFRDFPFVEILDLSHTTISDEGLAHLIDLPSLKTLSLVGTNVSDRGMAAFKRQRPTVEVETKPPPKGTVNPFTGKPI